MNITTARLTPASARRPTFSLAAVALGIAMLLPTTVFAASQSEQGEPAMESLTFDKSGFANQAVVKLSTVFTGNL